MQIIFTEEPTKHGSILEAGKLWLNHTQDNLQIELKGSGSPMIQSMKLTHTQARQLIKQLNALYYND